MTTTDTKRTSDPVKNTDTSLGGEGNGSRDSAHSDSVVLPMIQGLRVLVIGASKRRRESLARTLNKNNIQAVGTTADEHGYRTALKFNPDVAISEIARPGDPGWWLFKRFHRHPALKWTPALLMNWWAEKKGKEVVLTESVFERLAEALTPIRLLEERIAAGRNLSDRVETTGLPAVVDVIASAGISGTLTVNDSWNVFELEFLSGAPRSVSRRGVDGKLHKGHPAFMQMLLTDSGHWTFRNHNAVEAEKNVFLPLPALLDWSRNKLAMLFGPDVGFSKSQLLDNLRIDRTLFHDVASTFDGLGRDLLEGIAAGASENELNAIIGKNDKNEERVEVELAMIALVRCGALHVTENVAPASSVALKDAKRVVYILDWIAKDHQTEHHNEIGASAPKRKATTGFYSFNSVNSPQKIPQVKESPAAPESSATVDINDKEAVPQRDAMDHAEASWRRHFSEEQEKKASKFLGVVPHDSFAPGQSLEDKGQLQKWLAIAIAILLSALLITGLVVIGADDSLDDDDTSTDIDD